MPYVEPYQLISVYQTDVLVVMQSTRHQYEYLSASVDLRGCLMSVTPDSLYQTRDDYRVN